LLEERKRDNLRVRESLEGLVAAGDVGVEQRVSVIDEAEQDNDRLFRKDEPSGMVGTGHLSLLGEGG
jgi:hypothetical protein